MRVLQGGKFGHGFISAGFGEAVSPAVARWAGDSAGKQFVAGVVVGGTASRLAGGKFANGAQTGAFQWAFNRAAHGESDPAEEQEFSERKRGANPSRDAGIIYATAHRVGSVGPYHLAIEYTAIEGSVPMWISAGPEGFWFGRFGSIGVRFQFEQTH